MKKLSNGKALDAVQVTQTATSITRTQKLKDSHFLLWTTGGITSFVNIIALFAVPVNGNFENLIIALSMTPAFMGLGAILDKVFGKRKVKGSVSEYDNDNCLHRRELTKTPHGKMILSSTPFTVKHVSLKNLAIENIQYNESDKVEENLATHIMNEYAILQGKDIYFEQTIKETPLGMWQSAFHALADEERNLSTMSTSAHENIAELLEQEIGVFS